MNSRKIFIVRYWAFVRISSDDIKKRLILNKEKFSLNDLFGLQHKIISVLLSEGYSVISDSNSDNEKYRTQLKHIAKLSNAKVMTIFVDTTLHIAYARFIKLNNVPRRKRKKILKMIEMHYRNLSVPGSCIRINNNGEINKALIDLKINAMKIDSEFAFRILEGVELC